MSKMNILKVIGTVAVINILARLLGFLRELVIGYQFGTSEIADMIITVYTVPNFLYIVVGGAITTAFISVYRAEQDAAESFLRDSLKFVSIVGFALTLAALSLIWLFKGQLFEEYLENNGPLLNALLLWMIPSTFFLIISTWMNGLLNSRGKFAVSTFSSFIYNLFFLVIAVSLSFWLGASAYGIGAFAASIAMVVHLNRHIPLKPLVFPISRISAGPEIRQMVRLALPIILGGATIQFYFIIHRYFSLQLEEGFVAAVNYASKLTQFPQALLMTVVTTVLYPLISKGVKDGNKQFVGDVYANGIRVLGLLLIPAGMFIWFYGAELVEAVYEHGNFSSSASLITAPLLKIFGLSLFFISANMYITRFFYAFGISTTPVAISIFSVFGVNVGIILLFIGNYGADAIAWATVISSAVQYLLLLIFAKKMLNMKPNAAGWLLKDGILYILMASALFAGIRMAEGLNAIITLLIGLFAMSAVYVIGVKFLKIPLKKLLVK